MRYLLIMFTLLCSLSVYAEIYQTIDRDGVSSYSDIPSPNAKQIDVTPTNVVPAAQPKTSTTTSTTVEVDPNAPAARKPYTLFTFLAPKNEETIQNQPSFTVQVQSQPALQPGDKIGLFLDGNLQGVPQDGTQFTLVHIDRGTHQLRAVIVDKTGAVLKETPSITIYVRYASVNQPTRQ